MQENTKLEVVLEILEDIDSAKSILDMGDKIIVLEAIINRCSTIADNYPKINIYSKIVNHLLIECQLEIDSAIAISDSLEQSA